MKKTFTVLMMALLAVLLFTACDNKASEPKGEDPATPVEPTYTVTFNVNGGNGTIADKTTGTDGKVSEPETAPKRTDAVFLYWSKDKNSEFDFDTALTEDTTLYAVWKKEFAVGDIGPAGGVIFYVVPDGGSKTSTYGDDSLTWKYLEAAPADLTGTYLWGTADSYGSKGTGSDIGAGWSNARILSGSAFIAASACGAYGDNTDYDDWFLPSKAELEEMYNKRTEIGGFDCEASTGTYWYWSSSEGYMYSDAYAISFNNGTEEEMNDRCVCSFKVRPVRAF